MHDPAFLGLTASAATLGVLAIWKARVPRWIALAVLAASATWAAFSDSSPLNHDHQAHTAEPVTSRSGG